MPLKTFSSVWMVVLTVSALTRGGISPCPLLHWGCSYTDLVILHWHRPQLMVAHISSIRTERRSAAKNSWTYTTFTSTRVFLTSWPLEMLTSLWQHTVHRRTWRVYTHTGTDGGSTPEQPPLHTHFHIRLCSPSFLCCVLLMRHWPKTLKCASEWRRFALESYDSFILLSTETEHWIHSVLRWRIMILVILPMAQAALSDKSWTDPEVDPFGKQQGSLMFMTMADRNRL